MAFLILTQSEIITLSHLLPIYLDFFCKSAQGFGGLDTGIPAPCASGHEYVRANFGASGRREVTAEGLGLVAFVFKVV